MIVRTRDYIGIRSTEDYIVNPSTQDCIVNPWATGPWATGEGIQRRQRQTKVLSQGGWHGFPYGFEPPFGRCGQIP